MATYQYIYWRNDLPRNKEGERCANVHLLKDYDSSLTAIARMARLLRKTFPQAKNSEISVGKVTRSTYVYSFVVIMWTGHIPEGDYPEWDQKLDGPKGAYTIS
ncbi:MAG: hypothetical protein AAB552_01190 [Patescibacteria group bacterium]